ncbi:708_t:CDS:1, partial [Paraglomus occultum]
NIGIQLWEDVTINSDEDFDDTGIIHEVTKVVNAFKSQKGD